MNQKQLQKLINKEINNINKDISLMNLKLEKVNIIKNFCVQNKGKKITDNSIEPLLDSLTDFYLFYSLGYYHVLSHNPEIEVFFKISDYKKSVFDENHCVLIIEKLLTNINNLNSKLYNIQNINTISLLSDIKQLIKINKQYTKIWNKETQIIMKLRTELRNIFQEKNKIQDNIPELSFLSNLFS
jgi:hypothetical protein